MSVICPLSNVVQGAAHHGIVRWGSAEREEDRIALDFASGGGSHPDLRGLLYRNLLALEAPVDGGRNLDPRKIGSSPFLLDPCWDVARSWEIWMQGGKEKDAQASETREYTTFPMLLMGEREREKSQDPKIYFGKKSAHTYLAGCHLNRPPRSSSTLHTSQRVAVDSPT